MTKDNSRLFVESVRRAFTVLHAFHGREGLNLTEVSQISDIPIGTAQRFIHTLATLGYLRQGAGKRWYLTPHCLSLGAAYIASDALIGRANPHLVDLNQSCGESVNLSRPDGLDMVFVARFISHERSFIPMPLGTRIPMYCSASGRAYLSQLNRDQAEDIVRSAEYTAYTAHTISDPVLIMDEIDRARERGYATASEEYYVGDLSIAAAVQETDGSPMGCVNISGPTSRWTMERLESELAPRLVHTARAISPAGYFK